MTLENDFCHFLVGFEVPLGADEKMTFVIFFFSSMIKLQILENPALAAGAGRYHFLFSGWLGGGVEADGMGDLNAKPARKQKMVCPTVGFALISPMPLVSGGGGRSRPENRKWYVPPLASENLILDFPDILQHFFQGKQTEIQNLCCSLSKI